MEEIETEADKNDREVDIMEVDLLGESEGSGHYETLLSKISITMWNKKKRT
jgi:hypothetical protein